MGEGAHSQVSESNIEFNWKRKTSCILALVNDCIQEWYILHSPLTVLRRLLLIIVLLSF